MTGHAHDAKESLKDISNADWLETFARVGYSAKGVVYTVVGFLTVQTALGAGGQIAGAPDALREIGQQPFGQVLLALVALGLTCYAMWRLTLAAFDKRDHGTDTKGIIKRIGFGTSGLINLGLAFVAAWTVLGSGGGGGQTSPQGLTAQLMARPFGIWLIGFIGVAVIAVGAYQVRRAYTAKFMRKYIPEKMSARERTWARRLGRIGITARSVTFVMIGVFLVQAAIQHDPSETKGLGGAFRTLLEQPYGPFLLGAVAAGFICYGIYCFSAGRYHRFPTGG